jgi:SAM-dependent methyltransferase
VDKIPENLKRVMLKDHPLKTDALLDECVEIMQRRPYSKISSMALAALTQLERSILITKVMKSDMPIIDKATVIRRAAYPHFNRRIHSERKDEKEQEIGAFNYIPFPEDIFVEELEGLLNVSSSQRVSFMDVGCGIGDKMLLAKVLLGFDKVYGIELNRHTIELGRWSLSILTRHLYPGEEQLGCIKDGDCTFIHGDALDYDFGAHGFVYSYRPIRGRRVYELWAHIINTMPEKGWYVEVAPDSDFFSKYTSNKGMVWRTEGIIHKVNGVPHLVNSSALKEGRLELLEA